MGYGFITRRGGSDANKWIPILNEMKKLFELAKENETITPPVINDVKSHPNDGTYTVTFTPIKNETDKEKALYIYYKCNKTGKVNSWNFKSKDDNRIIYEEYSDNTLDVSRFVIYLKPSETYTITLNSNVSAVGELKQHTLKAWWV